MQPMCNVGERAFMSKMTVFTRAPYTLHWRVA
jgi:hypothetical protein